MNMIAEAISENHTDARYIEFVLIWLAGKNMLK